MTPQNDPPGTPPDPDFDTGGGPLINIFFGGILHFSKNDFSAIPAVTRFFGSQISDTICVVPGNSVKIGHFRVPGAFLGPPGGDPQK